MCVLALWSLSNTQAKTSVETLDQAAALIDLGEYQEAENRLQPILAEARGRGGNYSAKLARPLLLLGDAQLADKRPKQALDSYEHAWQVLRMNEGLASDKQTEALYRLSDVHVALGDYEAANMNQERACELIMNQYGFNDVRSLPAMLKLIEWYESNRRFSAAKLLYLRVIGIVNHYMLEDDPRRVDLGRAFARSMRNTVFPPMSGAGEFHPFSISVPGYEEPPFGEPPPSSYSLGYRALNRVLDFMVDSGEYPPNQITIAKLNLADWNQLFGRVAQSTRLYREIWNDLEDNTELRSQIFESPQLLYIRLPQYEPPASNRRSGLVELLLTVSYQGKVIGRISQEVVPRNKTIEHRTRMAARAARFRPAFKNGRPITTKRFIYMHEYPLRSSS